MCFVRKSLDWVFTRHELKWLDDIIPESHKREKEEKEIMMMEQEMEVHSSGCLLSSSHYIARPATFFWL